MRIRYIIVTARGRQIRSYQFSGAYTVCSARVRCGVAVINRSHFSSFTRGRTTVLKYVFSNALYARPPVPASSLQIIIRGRVAVLCSTAAIAAAAAAAASANAAVFVSRVV